MLIYKSAILLLAQPLSVGINYPVVKKMFSLVLLVLGKFTAGAGLVGRAEQLLKVVGSAHGEGGVHLVFVPSLLHLQGAASLFAQG